MPTFKNTNKNSRHLEMSKFRVIRFFKPPVRNLGGLTPLEKFERLRQLCCTSDVSRKREEIEYKIRPRTTEVCDDEESTCSPCSADGIPKELLDIKCKTALVLGGASGVGYEAANNLLKDGVMRVIIADRNQCAGSDSVKKLCATYGNNKAIFLMFDITEQASVESAFKEIYKYFCQVNVYVNCIAVYNEKPTCWENMIRTNLLGCVRAMLLAYEYMSGNPPDECCQGSVIINVSSYGSLSNVPSMPLFSAASNGINGLTSSFGSDFHFAQSRVRCVTVCPACTDSGLFKNMARNHYDSQWAGLSNQAMKCCSRQSSKVVGRAIVNAARFGLNGSVYVVKEGKYYRYAMPDYKRIMRQESVLL